MANSDFSAHLEGPSGVVHVYGRRLDDACAAAAAVAQDASGALVRLHIESGPNGACPDLMEMLGEAAAGDVVVIAARADLDGAPSRVRTRLAATANGRGVGMAFADDAEAMSCVLSGGAGSLSLQGAPRIGHTPPRVASRPAPASARLGEQAVLRLLHQGRTWDQVQRTLGVTRAFVAACARRLAAVEVAQSRAAILDSRQDGLATSLADD